MCFHEIVPRKACYVSNSLILCHGCSKPFLFCDYWHSGRDILGQQSIYYSWSKDSDLNEKFELEEVSKRIAEIDALDDQHRSLELLGEIRIEKAKKRLKKITFSQKVLQLLQYLRKKQRNVAFHQVNSYVDHNEMINSVYVMDEIVDKFDVILMDDTIQIFLRRRKEANYSKGKTRLLSFDLPPSKKCS